MKDGENRILFIKDFKMTDEKSELLNICSALNNEIEKCGKVESLSEFQSYGACVMNGHKEAVPKLKRDNPQKISL